MAGSYSIFQQYRPPTTLLVLMLLTCLVSGLRIDVWQRQTGIIDRALQKMQKKEDDERRMQEALAKKEQDRIEQATRKAKQLTSFNEDATIHEVLIKDDHKSSKMAQTPKYVATSKKDEAQIQEEADGFGSITEMVMNKDQLIQKQAQSELEQKHKQDAINQAKAKMTAALNNSGKKENVPDAEMVQQQGQAKLYDSSVAQVIDEVSSEQEAAHDAPKPQVVGDDKTEAGFIKKFASKQFGIDEGVAVEPKQEATDEEPEHKGMSERFRDQVAQDEKDEAKLGELIHQQQHMLEMKKKSVLERETERLVRDISDQNDEPEEKATL